MNLSGNLERLKFVLIHHRGGPDFGTGQFWIGKCCVSNKEFERFWPDRSRPAFARRDKSSVQT